MPDIDPQLTELIKAQLDANQIAQRDYNLKRRMEAAQLETISSTESLKQDVRQLVLETRKLLEYMQQTAFQDDALHDWFESLAHRIERLETGMMLVLMDKLDSKQVRREATKLVDGISKEHRERLKEQHIKNLSALQEQAASYGAIKVPLEIINAIKAEEEALNELD